MGRGYVVRWSELPNRRNNNNSFWQRLGNSIVCPSQQSASNQHTLPTSHPIQHDKSHNPYPAGPKPTACGTPKRQTRPTPQPPLPPTPKSLRPPGSPTSGRSGAPWSSARAVADDEIRPSGLGSRGRARREQPCGAIPRGWRLAVPAAFARCTIDRRRLTAKGYCRWERINEAGRSVDEIASSLHPRACMRGDLR